VKGRRRSSRERREKRGSNRIMNEEQEMEEGEKK
jgi:hypothetical protein